MGSEHVRKPKTQIQKPKLAVLCEARISKDQQVRLIHGRILEDESCANNSNIFVCNSYCKLYILLCFRETLLVLNRSESRGASVAATADPSCLERPERTWSFLMRVSALRQHNFFLYSLHCRIAHSGLHTIFIFTIFEFQISSGIP